MTVAALRRKSPVGPTRKSRDVCFRAAVRGIADANALVQLLLERSYPGTLLAALML
jgi:hypothetical protein